MSIRKESDGKRIGAVQGGSSSGGTSQGLAIEDKFGERIIRVGSLVLKDELFLFQTAAEKLARAGLGIYRFEIAERQEVPVTGKSLGDNSPFIAVTYVGQANREGLWEVISSVKNAKKSALRDGKSENEVEEAIQDAIKKGVQTQVGKKARQIFPH